jgi:energy-coupling factor transport system permease protein
MEKLFLMGQEKNFWKRDIKMRTKLEKHHPLFKLLWLTIITTIASVDYKPFLMFFWLLIGFFIAECFTKFKIKGVLKSTYYFWLVSLSFMFIITLTRYFDNQSLDILIILSLGSRIILISFYSVLFVKTTDPSELVICLVKYLKIPSKYGYAFLTAYRFFPTFKEEIEIIKYAHQVRGVKESGNFFIKIWQSKTYIIPMMSIAIRKGVRLTIAMETRAFGKYKNKTYMKKNEITKKDIIIFLFSIGILIFSICFLNYLGALDIRILYTGR